MKEDSCWSQGTAGPHLTSMPAAYREGVMEDPAARVPSSPPPAPLYRGDPAPPPGGFPSEDPHSGYPYPYGLHSLGMYLNQCRAHQSRTLQSLNLNRDSSTQDFEENFLSRKARAPKHLRIGALGKPGKFYFSSVLETLHLASQPLRHFVK